MTSRLNRELPPWSRGEYERRLLAQAIAWDGGTPLGRGMVLFPEHEEYSESAARERCAEAGDVQVPEPFRRRGVASALMRSLEDETRAAGFARIGLSVSEGDDGRAARARSTSASATGTRTARTSQVRGSRATTGRSRWARCCATW